MPDLRAYKVTRVMESCAAEDAAKAALAISLGKPAEPKAARALSKRGSPHITAAIRSMAGIYSAREIAERVGISVYAVRRRASRYGFSLAIRGNGYAQE